MFQESKVWEKKRFKILIVEMKKFFSFEISRLDRHLKTHENKLLMPTIECGVCEKKFKTDQSLKLHVKNQHENILNRAEHVGSNQKAIRKSLRCTD